MLLPRCLIFFNRPHAHKIQFVQLVILSKIPTEDPTSLSLPTDPFTTLTDLLQLDTLPPFDEKWQASKEVQLFIRKMLGFKPGMVKSERVIHDLKFADEPDMVVCRPMSPPILTRRAVRETPVLGASAPSKCAKKTFRDFMNAQVKLEPVDVEEIQELEVNLNQLLCVIHFPS
jgi:hypothetical protein